MRIYELARDLNIKSQKIIDLLAETSYKVTSHNSGIDDKAQNYIKNKIKKEEERKTEHMNNNEEKSEERVQDAQVERPKKKSSISAVFNPQNSKQSNAKKLHTTSSKSSTEPEKEKVSKSVENKKEESKQIKEKSSGRENVQKNEKDMPIKEVVEQKDEKVNVNKTADSTTEAVKATTQSTGTRRPYTGNSNNGERRPYAGNSNNGERRPYAGNSNNGERRPYAGNSNNGERRPYAGNSNNGERRPYAGNSSDGERRPYAGNSNNGERRPYAGNSNNGERRPYAGNSNNGERRPYAGNSNNGERRPYAGNSNNGERRPYAGNSNNGERRPYAGNSNNGERRPYAGNSNNGERRPYAGNSNNGERRPYAGNSNNGERRPYAGNSNNGDRRPYGDRRNSSNQGDGKLEQELNKFNKDSTKATPDELRTKESREKKERKPVKKIQNYSKKPKKQENYVNLEKQSGHKKRQQTPQPVQKVEEEIRTITVPELLTLKELADKMKLQASMIVKKLFLKGQMVTVNQEITYEMAEEIALEFNCITEPEVKVDVIEELLKEEDDDISTMIPRPAVVCVMGHVDHGKTSLLDAIRSTHVTDREAGGITQHIGASIVSINNQTITFLDTPGHEAFTAMRMRGANSTDIAILVVAADDGVMPQTIEAINHAKAAGIEIIVAINKIDKPSANIERVKQELSEYELIPEDWGGSTIFVPVSAHTGEGIKQLLEMILLTAEVSELKANPNRKARGVIIEAQLDKGRGAVATVLIQKGTLNIGEPVACGSAYGKVRAMVDDKGHRVKEAGPSTPVEIIGLSSVPEAGETFIAMESEKEARSFAETYVSQGRERLLEETKSRMSLDDLFSQIKSGNVKELDIIVKADVQGSVEAVKQSLNKLSNEEVMVKVIHGGVGAINESDVILASASNAIIIGFNVRPDPQAKMTAEREGVDMRLYKVIYNAIEDVAAAMKGMLDPIFEEKVLGHAEIRQLFQSSGVGTISGSYVLDGTFERGCKVRISREGTQIFEGDLASLKRFKDDVKEVRTGYECGLVFDGFNEVQELDIVEAYKMVEVPR